MFGMFRSVRMMSGLISASFARASTPSPASTSTTFSIRLSAWQINARIVGLSSTTITTIASTRISASLVPRHAEGAGIGTVELAGLVRGDRFAPARERDDRLQQLGSPLAHRFDLEAAGDAHDGL